MTPLRLLLSRWSISLLGTAMLAGLVWLFGPLLPGLEGWGGRLAVVVVLLLVWAVANLLLELRRRGRDAVLTKGVTTGAAEETAALREKLATALGLLKRARGSRGYLYEQPWYAIIGPPGAGKTTALLNAGLNFPLAAEMGQGALTGVGGTRLCEWWFTDDAVLIDTAGRYTTQDSDAAVDRAGWEAFLDLLKRTRPRQPLNGVLVAIGLSDIAQAPAADRMAHAKAIRGRVKELHARLGVRMPVYALFTKADLIAGFAQFFDDLDEAQRAQVWGVTAPPASDMVASFATEFRALVDRLQHRMFARLQAEPNAERRALIAMFPQQVASLEQPLTEFLQAAFGGTPGDPAPLLRGAYFTSGTQEGTPIDRLIGTISRSFGLDQRRGQPVRPGQGRSYFLGRLLREVIFGEAMLVARDPAALRRRAMVRAAGIAAAAVVVVAAGGMLWVARTAGHRQIDAASGALSEYEQTAKSLPLDRVNDADLPPLVPLLDQADALSAGANGTPSGWWMLGLSQDAKLAAAGRAVYRHALERALLPRLLWRLEGQLRDSMGRPDYLYEATRVYLMLGSAGPLDHELVHEWMRLDWQGAFAGDELAPVRDRLLHHLDALLTEPLPSVSLDGDLVTRARRAFGGVPLSERAYSIIRASAGQRLPLWRPSDALGAAGIGMFVRASGKPLSDGIPGFFTVDGFRKLLLPSLGTAATTAISESWVLGKRIEVDPGGPEMRKLEREMVLLYETDYGRQWDEMLADLNVAPMRSRFRAAQDLYILASPESPMRALLVSIARQLRLAAPPGGAATTAAPAPAPDSVTARLEAVVPNAKTPEAEATVPGREIEDRFKALLSLVGDGPGAPIDQVLKSLTDIQQQTAKLAASAAGAAPPSTGADPAAALLDEARQQPQPVARWLAQIAQSGIALRGTSPGGQIAAVYNGPGGPASVCPGVVNGHFPFARPGTADVSLDDFSRLFAPGALFDGFVSTLLRPYVDMTGATWRPVAAEGVPAPVSTADLAQFQRAWKIRDAFFGGGGTKPSIHLEIAPVSLDRTSRQATLDLGTAVVVVSRDPPRPTQIAWPGPPSARTARLTFDPPLPAGAQGTFEESGPWAMFRLFARGKLQLGTSADRFTLTFHAGDREAVFDIRAGASPNALTPDLLPEFRCPEVSGT